MQLSIARTSNNAHNLSRHELLKWVNLTLDGEYKKLEELCSGVAYCQLLHLLFPRSINMKKVKMSAKLETEYIHNLKLCQAAFARLNIDKSVPIDRLVLGRFQDNLEFVQWFKKFFDTYHGDKELLEASNAALAETGSTKGMRFITEAGNDGESKSNHTDELGHHKIM